MDYAYNGGGNGQIICLLRMILQKLNAIVSADTIRTIVNTAIDDALTNDDGAEGTGDALTDQQFNATMGNPSTGDSNWKDSGYVNVLGAFNALFTVLGSTDDWGKADPKTVLAAFTGLSEALSSLAKVIGSADSLTNMTGSTKTVTAALNEIIVNIGSGSGGGSGGDSGLSSADVEQILRNILYIIITGDASQSNVDASTFNGLFTGTDPKSPSLKHIASAIAAVAQDVDGIAKSISATTTADYTVTVAPQTNVFSVTIGDDAYDVIMHDTTGSQIKLTKTNGTNVVYGSGDVAITGLVVANNKFIYHGKALAAIACKTTDAQSLTAAYQLEDIQNILLVPSSSTGS